MADIQITLPDGSQRSFAEGATATDVAASIGSRLAKAALAADVDGAELDLNVALPDNSKVAIITGDSDAGRHILRHSTAHVMAQAVTQLFPGAKYAIGPAIVDGFYYDFELPDGKTFSEDDLGRIEDEMRRIVAADQRFVREELDYDAGLALFGDQRFKQEIITKVRGGAADTDDAGEAGGADGVSVYRNVDAEGSVDFVDLCRGPHVPSTGRLGAFKLMRVAGAYWRGNEKGPQLQRIYGTAGDSTGRRTGTQEAEGRARGGGRGEASAGAPGRPGTVPFFPPPPGGIGSG